MVNTPSNSQLASEIKKSNKQAFELFYFRYYKLLFHYIASRVQSSETAR